MICRSTWSEASFRTARSVGLRKTTTLRMIGGFEGTSEGTISLGGTDVTDLPPFKRNVQPVFQKYALFPHLNVYENIAFGLRRRKVAEGRGGTRCVHAQAVDLPATRSAGRASSPAASSSASLWRGHWSTTRRCCFSTSRSCARSQAAKQMQVELKRIQSEIGITFIFVTHDQEER